MLVLSSINLAHSQIGDQGQLIADIHARPSAAALDRTALIEVARDYLLPVLRNDLVSNVRTVTATVVSQALSTNSAGIHASPQRRFATVATSTDDLPRTPERVLLSFATQTEDNVVAAVSTTPSTDDLTLVPECVVVSSETQTDANNGSAVPTTPSLQTPQVPCDNSVMTEPTEIGGDALPELVDVCLPAPMEDLPISPGQSFPNSALRVPDVEVINDHPVFDEGSANMETQGVSI